MHFAVVILKEPFRDASWFIFLPISCLSPYLSKTNAPSSDGFYCIYRRDKTETDLRNSCFLLIRKHLLNNINRL